MALVSESMSVQVVDWMSTQSCLQRSMSGFTRFFHPGFTYSSIPPYATKNKQFEIFLSDFPQLDDFGVMCKRITCLNDTRKRLNFSVEAFLRALDLHTEMIKERMSKGEISPLSTDWINVINFVQFCKSTCFIGAWPNCSHKESFLFFFRQNDAHFYSWLGRNRIHTCD